MDNFLNGLIPTPSYDPDEIHKYEIDLAIDYLNGFLKKISIHESYYYIKELQDIFEKLSEFEKSKHTNLLNQEAFPRAFLSEKDPLRSNRIGNYRKVSIARLLLSILISCENTTHNFYKADSEGPTKNGYYINNIITTGISFYILTTDCPSPLDEKGNHLYFNLDFNDFVLHPCPESKKNWLYLKNEYGSKYTCKKCGRSFHTNNKNIAVNSLQVFDKLLFKPMTQLSSEDFKIFLNNCFEKHKPYIPKSIHSKAEYESWEDSKSDDSWFYDGFNGDTDACWGVLD